MDVSPGQERIKQFNKLIVAEYLKYGSVDEVFRQNNYDLPISYPEVHRLIKRWGIVKSAGPNSLLSEGITFLTLLSQNKVPLESLYKRLPPSFKTSMGTMHRLLHNIKEGVIRRVGTALVITPFNNPHLFLIGEDVSTPRLELGKPFGSTTLPMGYSKVDEDAGDSILRVLQQEVFTRMAIDRILPIELIPANPKPFMHVDIADISVAVYNLSLPGNLSEESAFSSFKVRNHKFTEISEILNHKSLPSRQADNILIRAGVREIIGGYQKYLYRGINLVPVTSEMNLALAVL